MTFLLNESIKNNVVLKTEIALAIQLQISTNQLQAIQLIRVKFLIYTIFFKI